MTKLTNLYGGQTETFTERGCVYHAGDDSAQEAMLRLHVSSTGEGKRMALEDPRTGTLYIFSADLLAFWLEHGTEG